MIFLPFKEISQTFESIDSTNLEAGRVLDANLSHPKVIIARKQTSGRGRFDRSWESPIGNIYMSIIIPQTLCSVLTLPFAVAIGTRNAITPNRDIFFKWPNDLLIVANEPKKFCGILIEKYKSHYIIGVGINVVSYPDNVRYAATSLVEISASTNAESVYSEVISAICSDNIREKWMQNAYYINKSIMVDGICGEFFGIDTSMNAILKTDNGIKSFCYGDITSIKM